MAATSLQPVVVWWARKDLREFDNPALAEAHGSASRQGAALLVLWVGEARAAGEKGITSGLGRVPWARAALHSRAFVSLALRLWERLGVPAVFAADRASSAVAALARVLAEQDIRIVEAHATALPGPEEAAEETAVQSVLAARGAALTVHDGWLLAPARCLPVSAWSGTGGAGSGVPATTRAPLDAATLAPLARTLPQGADVQGVARAIPDTMTRFRRAVTAHVCLEACLPSPDSPPLPHPGVCPQALQRAVPAMVVAPAALAGGPRPDHAARALALRLARYLTSPLRPCDDTEETLRLDACPPPHHGDGESGSDYEGTPAEQQGVEEEAWDRLCAFLGSDAAPLRRHIASLPRTPLAPSTEAGTLPSPEHAPVDQFHQTRSALATGAGQSGLGAFLSAGVLSPRACAVAALATRPAGLYGELLAAEARAGASGSSGSKRRRRRDPPTMGRDHFVMHLLIRDFFALQMFKYGRAWFGPSAIRRPPQAWAWHPEWRERMERLRAAQSGVPLVDAAAAQLAATGHVSNRARQCLASYVVHDLRAPWLAGAEWFESTLVDYDAASNYVNWAYFAGVGNDAHQRKFDLVGQGERYDPQAHFLAAAAPLLPGPHTAPRCYHEVRPDAVLDPEGPTVRTAAERGAS